MLRLIDPIQDLKDEIEMLERRQADRRHHINQLEELYGRKGLELANLKARLAQELGNG